MPKINKEKKRANRDSILEVARELFYKNGYNKTSVNDIIKKSGISKGKFYTYFKSKEELFFALVHENDKKIIHHGRDLVSTKTNLSCLGDYIRYRLERFIDEENKIRAKYTFEFWTSSKLNASQKDAMQSRFREFQYDVIKIISEGCRRGIYRTNISVKAFTHVLMATLDGLILYDAALHREIDGEIIDITIDIFNNYLGGVDDNV